MNDRKSRLILKQFLSARVQAVCVESSGELRLDAAVPRVLLPGSFNPLHEGHRGMALTARDRLGSEVDYELSAINVDKPALDLETILRRAEQFRGVARLWLTRAPTFVEKGRLFAEITFVVGADTAERIVQPQYYGSAYAMEAALAEIARRRCRFLVAGRVDAEGQFLTVNELAIPPEHRSLFEALPFRLDCSSTALRAAHA
jgi:nicotinic acid mononucleotide adenylyltransferase